MIPRLRFALNLAALSTLTACLASTPSRDPSNQPAREIAKPTVATKPPMFLIGAFTDDYGNSYQIDSASWTQLPHGRFNVLYWNTDSSYLIAKNDSSNTFAPGLYTRIDWVALKDMSPWKWAYCLSAYQARSKAEAESTSVAIKANPRNGCNGYPFSRMRKATQ